MVKVVIDGNRLFMEHAQETLEMLEHKRWYTDAETQNANTDAATQKRTQMLQHKMRTQTLQHKCEHRCWLNHRCWNTTAGTRMLKHDCWNMNAETQLLNHR
jgi:hypothetical protein